jgi:hypothetical protein
MLNLNGPAAWFSFHLHFHDSLYLFLIRGLRKNDVDGYQYLSKKEVAQKRTLADKKTAWSIFSAFSRCAVSI